MQNSSKTCNLPIVKRFCIRFDRMLSGRFIDSIRKVDVRQHFHVFDQCIFVDELLFEVKFSDFLEYSFHFL